MPDAPSPSRCGSCRKAVTPRVQKKNKQQTIEKGDIVEIGFNSGTVKFKVLFIKETVRKEEAEKMYEIIFE